MKCRRDNCSNVSRKTRLNGLCDKHNKLVSTTGYIDASKVRQHLAVLHERGRSWQSIADSAGMTRDGLYLIRSGKSRRVQLATAKRLLALPLPPEQPTPNLGRGLVSSLGGRRRVQALIAIGHSRNTIAREAGLSSMALYRLFRSDLTAAETASAIAGAFRRLEHIPGSNTRSVIEAERKGWPLPFEWDEDAIDDPDEKPFVAKGQLSRNRLYEYLTLKDAGMSDSAIAREFGISPPTLYQWLLRQRKKGNLPSTDVTAAAS